MTDLFRPLSICGFLLLPLVLNAAEPEGKQIPPPQAPFVAKPRPDTTWDVRMLGSAKPADNKTTAAPAVGVAPDAARGSNYVDKIRYVVGTDITSISLDYSGGTKADHYLKGEMDYTLYLPSKQTYVSSYGEPRVEEPFVSRSYPGMSWISLSNYAGVEPIDNVMCYHFHRAAVIPKEGQPMESTRPELDAWVDVATKIPVRFKIDAETYAYTPPQPAPANVEFPGELKAEIQRAENESKALELMRQINAKAGAQ